MRKLNGYLALALMLSTIGQLFCGDVDAQEFVVPFNGGPNNCNAGPPASGGCVFKTQPGQLFGYQVQNWSATAVNVFVLDANAIPGSGSVAPIAVFSLAAGTTSAPTEVDRIFFPSAAQMLNGITIVCSAQTALSGGNIQFVAAPTTCTFVAAYH